MAGPPYFPFGSGWEGILGGPPASGDDEYELGPVRLAVVDQDVLTWRRAELSRLGFTGDELLSLAADAAVDLHVLEGMLADGCPLDTAYRIVA